MAGLSKLILPSSSLSASDVADNFNALKTVVNDLGDPNLDTGAINSRHFTKDSDAYLFAAPKLPLKKTYRTTFTATGVPNTGYGEIVRFSDATSGVIPKLHKADTIVFVEARLMVSHSGASSTPITVGATEAYSFRMECVLTNGTGAPTIFGDFTNDTERHVTPGSAVAGVYSEKVEVVLFGHFPVTSGYSKFEARVLGKSTLYDLSTVGSSNASVEGVISALVVAR